MKATRKESCSARAIAVSLPPLKKKKKKRFHHVFFVGWRELVVGASDRKGWVKVHDSSGLEKVFLGR